MRVEKKLKDMFSLAVLCVCLSSVTQVLTETITITPNSGGMHLKIPAGSSPILTCTLQSDPGDPTPQLNWLFNFQPLTQSEKYGIQEKDEGNRVITTSLTIRNTEDDDTGTYRCENTRTTAEADVNVIIYIVPTITTNGDHILELNKTILLVCIVTGENYDGWPVSWTKDGKSIPAIPGMHDLDKDGRDDVEVLLNGSLVLHNVDKDDIGIYECTVHYDVYEETLSESKDIRVYELEGKEVKDSAATTSAPSLFAMATVVYSLCRSHLLYMSAEV
ncbi:cell adhesion molecule 2-like [Glandiceps talaboti]